MPETTGGNSLLPPSAISGGDALARDPTNPRTRFVLYSDRCPFCLCQQFFHDHLLPFIYVNL